MFSEKCTKLNYCDPTGILTLSLTFYRIQDLISSVILVLKDILIDRKHEFSTRKQVKNNFWKWTFVYMWKTYSWIRKYKNILKLWLTVIFSCFSSDIKDIKFEDTKQYYYMYLDTKSLQYRTLQTWEDLYFGDVTVYSINTHCILFSVLPWG